MEGWGRSVNRQGTGANTLRPRTYGVLTAGAWRGRVPGSKKIAAIYARMATETGRGA
jgi:hypothetical protein